MADWTHFMIHCSDTPPSFDVNPDHIRQWHIEENGWSRVGYSELIRRNGILDIMVPFDRDDIIETWEISNGAAGWNGRTKHICWVGGKAQNGGVEDNRTDTQKMVLGAIVKNIVMLWPDIKVIGHFQVHPSKYCPSFDVRQWAKSIGIEDKNIDFDMYVDNPYFA